MYKGSSATFCSSSLACHSRRPTPFGILASRFRLEISRRGRHLVTVFSEVKAKVVRVGSKTQRFELKTSTDLHKQTMTRTQGICLGRTVVDVGWALGLMGPRSCMELSLSRARVRRA